MVNSTGSANDKVIRFWSESIKKNFEAINLPQRGNYYITKSSTIHTHTASIVEQKQKYNGNKHTKGVYIQ